MPEPVPQGTGALICSGSLVPWLCLPPPPPLVSSCFSRLVPGKPHPIFIPPPLTHGSLSTPPHAVLTTSMLLLPCLDTSTSKVLRPRVLLLIVPGNSERIGRPQLPISPPPSSWLSSRQIYGVIRDQINHKCCAKQYVSGARQGGVRMVFLKELTWKVLWQ